MSPPGGISRIIQAIVLCDTGETPLAKAGGRVFVEHVLWNLRRQGVRQIFLTGPGAGPVAKHLASNPVPDMAVERMEPLATTRLDDWLYIVRANALADASLPALAANTRQAGFLGGMLVTSGGIKAGAYVVSRSVLEPSAPGIYLEELLEDLHCKKLLAVCTRADMVLDARTPEGLETARRVLPEWLRKPTLFLDRDGVLNRDTGYVHSPQGFVWMPEAREAVRWANENGMYVFVVTNQSGIGRGMYTRQQFREFTSWINGQLFLAGAYVDATYHCPHHPTAGLGEYKTACNCRKPLPGMLQQAMREWRVVAERSVLVGDRDSDLEAARAAGVRGHKYTGGSLLQAVRGVFADMARECKAHVRRNAGTITEP